MAFKRKSKDKRNMKVSAGILMYRLNPELEVFLVHPGGPFYRKKDKGYWSIPKGEVKDEEVFEKTAIREFEEETSIDVSGKLSYLGEIVQPSGKHVHAWAYKHDFRGKIESNLVHHPKFGKFPEVDKGEYFSVQEAKETVMSKQIPLIENLEKQLSDGI